MTDRAAPLDKLNMVNRFLYSVVLPVTEAVLIFIGIIELCSGSVKGRNETGR